MILQFAQSALSLVAAGGAVLIVAGLVRETLHDNGRHFHLFPEAHDPPGMPVADAAETAPARPFPHARDDQAHREEFGRGDNDRGPASQRRKKRRRGKRRNRPQDHAKRSSRAPLVETADA